MESTQEERLLIISNNVLSNTRNNGKTIFSYIDSLSRENVAQLYFNGERPSIEGYRYFQITDKDVLRGLFSKSKRGRALCDAKGATNEVATVAPKLKKSVFRFFRELLWKNKWQSEQLFDWVENFAPTAVFFVGGDCVFAYDICEYIVKKYHARLSLYITDDYIMPRKKESFIEKARRKKIKESMERCLKSADAFFTVSEFMRKEYRELFGRDSSVIVNLSEPLKMQESFSENQDYTFMYAGSLYYGRDEILGKISRALAEYNQTHAKKAVLKVYSNSEPPLDTKSKFIIDGTSEYCGSLDRDELKVSLNRSDVLVFVESFDEEQMEKTKYSLSTKVPEYLSVGKPILAVGPMGIGSIDYLADVALCVQDAKELNQKITSLLDNPSLRDQIAVACENKYKNNHNKEDLQRNFVEQIFGC